MKSIYVFCLSFVIFGCQSYYDSQERAFNKAVEMQIAYQNQAQQPMFKVELTDDGKLKAFEAYHARQAPPIMQYRPVNQPGWQLLNTATSIIGIPLSLYWSAKGTADIVRATGNSISNALCNANAGGNPVNNTTNSYNTTNTKSEDNDRSITDSFKHSEETATATMTTTYENSGNSMEGSHNADNSDHSTNESTNVIPPVVVPPVFAPVQP